MLFDDLRKLIRTPSTAGPLTGTVRLVPAFALSLLLLLDACSPRDETKNVAEGGANGGSGKAAIRSYTTDFPLTEAVISEGGRWAEGSAAGQQWDRLQTATDFAFGSSPTGKYTDPTAVLTGPWSPDQMAEGTIRIGGVNSSCCHEVELRLRTTIVPHSITGYEINCSVARDQPYIQIVRWNGPLNSFDYVASNGSVGCGDGDVLRATITGSTITVYKNGAKVLQGTDSSFGSGAPGIGFYETDDNVGYYGFSSFTASNLASQGGAFVK